MFINNENNKFSVDMLCSVPMFRLGDTTWLLKITRVSTILLVWQSAQKGGQGTRTQQTNNK
jgi:hypothetical protein